MNDNQNVFMDGKRTTSRVTTEPGGKSSVHLGWDSPPPKSKRCWTIFIYINIFLFIVTVSIFFAHTANSAKEAKGQKGKENNFMQVVGSSASNGNMTDIAEKATAKAPSAGSRGVSSNLYASGSSQNTGNVITDRPTSRVTQPPGGRSSISFC